MISSKSVVNESIIMNGAGPAEKALAKRWARQAVIAIGVMPEQFDYLSAKVDVESNGTFKKPDGGKNIFILYNVFGCKVDGTKVELFHIGKGNKDVWTDCCPFYSRSVCPDSRAIMEGTDHFFFPNLPPNQVIQKYNKLQIHYIGLKKDDEGYVMIPNDWEMAISEFCAWKSLQYKRVRDRRSIPFEEVITAKKEWLREKASAYGDSKLVTRQMLQQKALEEWSTPIRYAKGFME